MGEEEQQADETPGVGAGEKTMEDDETLSPDELELQEAQRGKGYGAEPDE